MIRLLLILFLIILALPLKSEAKVLVAAYAGNYPVIVCQPNDTSIGCSGVVSNWQLSVPTYSNEPCTPGVYSADMSYFYICQSPNTWLRVGIATWGTSPSNYLTFKGVYLTFKGQYLTQ